MGLRVACKNYRSRADRFDDVRLRSGEFGKLMFLFGIQHPVEKTVCHLLYLSQFMNLLQMHFFAFGKLWKELPSSGKGNIFELPHVTQKKAKYFLVNPEGILPILSLGASF